MRKANGIKGLQVFAKKIKKIYKKVLTNKNRYDIIVHVAKIIWKHSSVGRASALQAEGHRFEPYCFHHGHASVRFIWPGSSVG